MEPHQSGPAAPTSTAASSMMTRSSGSSLQLPGEKSFAKRADQGVCKGAAGGTNGTFFSLENVQQCQDNSSHFGKNATELRGFCRPTTGWGICN